jgi:hypothetical protein
MIACKKIEIIDEELINEKIDDDTSYLFVMLHVDEKLNKIVSDDREICTKEIELVNSTMSNVEHGTKPLYGDRNYVENS